MDTLGIEPRASRMLSGCDTTTPCAHWFDPNLKSSLLAVRVVHIMAHTAELSTQHHTFHRPNDNNFFTLMSLLQIHLLSNSHMCRPCFAVACEIASAGNRTRVTSMATMYSTTRPLMHVCYIRRCTGPCLYSRSICRSHVYPYVYCGVHIDDKINMLL